MLYNFFYKYYRAIKLTRIQNIVHFKFALTILEIYDIIKNSSYIFLFADSDNSTIESVTQEILGNISVLSVAEEIELL